MANGIARALGLDEQDPTVLDRVMGVLRRALFTDAVQSMYGFDSKGDWSIDDPSGRKDGRFQTWTRDLFATLYFMGIRHNEGLVVTGAPLTAESDCLQVGSSLLSCLSSTTTPACLPPTTYGCHPFSAGMSSRN